MIRAVEARTMDTGVTIYKIPADVRRSDLESATHQHNASVEAAEAVRRHAVQQDMADGYVLTGYFYSAFAHLNAHRRASRKASARWSTAWT